MGMRLPPERFEVFVKSRLPFHFTIFLSSALKFDSRIRLGEARGRRRGGMKGESMYGAGGEPIHNFTKAENDALTQVGPGSVMGNLFRQYWLPVTAATDMQEATGRPLRVKLLGEDLTLFRTHNGQLGLVGSFCAHRLSPLFFGRVESDGLRCPYHGWKFAPDGKCLEMPNIPAEQEFTDEIHHPGYPAVERGGIICHSM